nr:hypothetical protein [uncultured Ruminococcus sp.]
MKTDFHQIINTIIKKVIELVKKYIRVILIGVLCICAILGFFSIVKLSHPKTIKDKIIEKCGNATDINISMSDITDFEWDKCIVYGPSTQTKDICDVFNIDYNTYLDLNYGIIFLNKNNVVYEETFDVSDNDLENKIPEFIIYPYKQNESTQVKYASFEKDKAEFKCVKKESDNGCYYRSYPV